MSKIELKPCPFCGGKAEIKRAFGASPRIRNAFFKAYYLEENYCIHCKGCGFEMPEFAVSIQIDEDNLSLISTFEKEVQWWVKRWNRRVDNEQREAD